METEFSKVDVAGVKQLLEDNGEHIEDLGLSDEQILRMLEQGF